MSVYVDEMRSYGRRGYWCHMMADSLDELHEMAKRIGLRREWFQDDLRKPHYDLVVSMRKRAIKYGAISVSSEWLLVRKELKR